MPSASDTLTPDLDSTPGTTPPTGQGLHPSTASTAKKKKKSKKNGRQQKPWDDASEDTPYPKSVTPSPPAEHFSGVRLSAEPTPPNSEPEGVKEDEDAAMAAWDQTPPQMPEELGLELAPEMDDDPQPELLIEDFGDRPELLIEDFGDLDAGLNPPEPERRPPSPKPLPAPAPVVSSPLSSPRPQKAAPVTAQAPPTPAPVISSPLSSPRPRKVTPTAIQAPPTPAPLAKRNLPSRPLDHDTDSTFPRPSITERRRTDSMTQPTSPVPRKSFVEPVNPPHMKQNHYFAVPGLDFGRGATKSEKGGKQAGSEHYCCCFDSFGNAGDVASAARARDALIVGWEGGLEVYRVLSDKMEIVGRLEGLRGGVVGAKILPWSNLSGGSPALLPLVALVIHGPMDGQARSSGRDDDDQLSDGEETTKHYQTTVEVFSLQTQKHVSTLYKSLPVALPEAKLGLFATVPEPVGDLRLDAKGNFLTIASGKSGEIFVFAQKREGVRGSNFRCIGKYWTSLQLRFDVQTKSNASTEHLSSSDVLEPQTTPLLSLSGRWLAFVPPSSSSKISVQGTLALSEGYQQPPGVGSHLAPPQPLVSCDIVGLNSEGVLAKYSRQAAQEFLKASRRGIEMGMAGWREFTQPSPPSRTAQRTEGGEEVFPPTNAPGDDTRRTTKEPAVVAIMDLERLLDAEESHAKHLPPPLASFALDDGCNYLSLSTDGLRLLTTSRKGEVSYIWDLRYAAHGSCQKRDVGNGDTVMGPHVTRVQRIVRNSHAVVLDTAWARDGNFVAMLTAHGTVHLHEISARAQESQRRRRKSTITAAPVDKADATVSLSTGLSPPSSNGFLGGIRSGWQTMSTQVSAMRAPNPAPESRATFGIPTTFAGFREVTNAGAAASGRAIARGLSQGYSAARIGAADVWHADDNKIKHKDIPNNVAARTVRWLRTRSGMSIAVTCGGKVYLYPIQRVTRQRGETAFSGLKAESKGRREFGLPPIATTSAATQSNRTNSCAQQGPHGFWGLRAPAFTQHNIADVNSKTLQDSESEKAHYETNPPFCPLYIDRRVSMLGFNSPSHSYENGMHDLAVSEFQVKGHGLDDEQPWLFGEPLPSSIKLNDRSAVDDVSVSDEDDDEGMHSNRQDIMTFDAELDGAGGAENVRGDGNVQSRILINPANNEIRINSSRKKPRKLMASPKATMKSAAAKADGDFELLEDDEEGGMF
jgi:hypothetical protein